MKCKLSNETKHKERERVNESGCTRKIDGKENQTENRKRNEMKKEIESVQRKKKENAKMDKNLSMKTKEPKRKRRRNNIVYIYI